MQAQHQDGVDPEAVEQQLTRILASADFVNSERLAAFLNYIVAKTLRGQPEQIKEYTIGVDVFGKADSFDPRLDTLVRVQASKLRSRLEKYYSTQGRQDPIVIELPRGTYVPIIKRNGSTPASAPSGVVNRKRALYVTASIAVLAIMVSVAWLAFHPSRKDEPASPEKSIAVLPFLDLSPEKNHEYFCDGMTEELITQLARIKGLRVVA